MLGLINGLLEGAVARAASDIHLEPCETGLRVRYRVAGKLHQAAAHEARLPRPLLSHLKLMAGLDVAESRLPQQAILQIELQGRKRVFRITTVPEQAGESAVLQVMDDSAAVGDLAAQGFGSQLLARMKRVFDQKEGLMLVAGPSGSGRSATLYAMLTMLNGDARKIVTIEDPVERMLPGISQIPVRRGLNLGYAALLHSTARLDADLIMVGEIADPATAELATGQAAEGCLVLAASWAETAVGAISRLRQLGVADARLAGALRGILVQHLVRRLCRQCRQPGPISQALKQRFNLQADRIFYVQGCEACGGTGYDGRVLIAELLIPDAALEQLLAQNAALDRLQQAAIAGGMRPLLQAGMDAAAAGETTVEEILRAVALPPE